MGKILLVTDSWNSSFLSDGYLKSQLASFLPREDLKIYLLDDVQDGASQSALTHDGYSFFSHSLKRKPIKPPFFLRRFRFVFVYLKVLWIRYFEVRKTVSQIIRFVRANEISKIWIVVQDPYLLWISEGILRKKFENVFVQYSFSGSSWVKKERLDRMTDLLAGKSRQVVLQKSTNLAVESLAAQVNLSRDSQLFYPTMPVSHGNDISGCSDRIVIGVIGPLKGKDSFENLISALDSIYWELDGKKIEIHYWGDGELPSNRTRIIRRGYRDFEDFRNGIARCSMLYFPYPFEARLKERTEISFPIEMMFALNTKVPYLYHGPMYGEPVSSFHNICQFCFSQDREVIKMFIRKLVHFGSDQESLMARERKFVDLKRFDAKQDLIRFLKLDSTHKFGLSMEGEV